MESENGSMNPPGERENPVEGESAASGSENETYSWPVKPRPQFVAKAGDMLEIGGMLYQEAESLLRAGQKKRLRLRLGHKTLAEVPLATGAAAVLATVMVALAISRLTIEIE
jgi:hypothetical protein